MYTTSYILFLAFAEYVLMEIADVYYVLHLISSVY